MKKTIIFFSSLCLLQACSNNGGESGVVNDGIKLVDSNGGLADTPYRGDQSATDTSKMEHRVGLLKEIRLIENSFT